MNRALHELFNIIYVNYELNETCDAFMDYSIIQDADYELNETCDAVMNYSIIDVVDYELNKTCDTVMNYSILFTWIMN
jgi:hypothetical protein